MAAKIKRPSRWYPRTCDLTMENNITQEELRKMEAELRRLINLSSLTSAPLESDFNEVIKQWQKDRKSQFWSRMAIRCLCAAIEARLFILRRMAEKMAPLGGVQFEPEETEILTEERIVEKNGAKTKKPKWLPFQDSVKESFRLFAKATGATIKIDYGVGGYTALCKTFELRNRLMHPKSPFDVEVRIRDIETVDQAIAWFNRTFKHTVDECQAFIDKRVEAERKSKAGPKTI
jgi:hypothetical protein